MPDKKTAAILLASGAFAGSALTASLQPKVAPIQTLQSVEQRSLQLGKREAELDKREARTSTQALAKDAVWIQSRSVQQTREKQGCTALVIENAALRAQLMKAK